MAGSFCFLAVVGVLPAAPENRYLDAGLAAAFPKGAGTIWTGHCSVGITMGVLTFIGGYFYEV